MSPLPKPYDHHYYYLDMPKRSLNLHNRSIWQREMTKRIDETEKKEITRKMEMPGVEVDKWVASKPHSCAGEMRNQSADGRRRERRRSTRDAEWGKKNKTIYRIDRERYFSLSVDCATVLTVVNGAAVTACCCCHHSDHSNWNILKMMTMIDLPKHKCPPEIAFRCVCRARARPLSFAAHNHIYLIFNDNQQPIESISVRQRAYLFRKCVCVCVCVVDVGEKLLFIFGNECV